MSRGAPMPRISSTPRAEGVATTWWQTPRATQTIPFRMFSLREEENMFYPKMKWLAPIVGAAMLALTSTAMAADVELSFYYPVAVGGPITKIIDGYAADFEKENPGIKIKAIYAG